MKCNQWTLGLAAAGVISLGSVAQAEEAASSQLLTALSSTTLSGYVDTSAIWKFGTGNANMPGRSYDGAGKQDGFNLNVVKLSLEKPLDEGQWSAGYKVDLLFGPDANTFNTASVAGGNDSDFAVKQAYVALRAPVGNGLDLKLGVFDTIIGYEVFDSVNNPNYSRSYGYFLEPTTYTGVLASYKVNDMFSISAGVADPGAPTINGRNVLIESQKAYMGSVVVTAPEDAGFISGASFYAGMIANGRTGTSVAGTAPGVGTTYYNYYVGATIPTPVEALAVGIAYDYRGSSESGSFGAGGPSPDYINSTYANAIGLYASYKATEKLKINVRGEYAWGTAGTWTAAGLNTDPVPGGVSHPDQFIGVTTSLDYSLWENVLSRLEFRWDHDASGGPAAFGGTIPGVSVPPPGDTTNRGTQKNAVSLALNVIYKF